MYTDVRWRKGAQCWRNNIVALGSMTCYAVFTSACFGLFWVIAFVFCATEGNSLSAEWASILTAVTALIALCLVVPFQIEANKPLGSGMALAILWTMTACFFDLGQVSALAVHPDLVTAMAVLVNISFPVVFAFYVCRRED